MKLRVVFQTALILMFSFACTHGQNFKEINSNEVSTLLQNDKKIVILDVRTAEEYNEGHLKQ
jgi:predicted sulfurtransferase